MAAESLTVLVAFSAGLLSFLSPCVLPLVPSYITFITGLGLEDVARARRTTLVHAVLFVLGFSFIFVALGAGATAFGQLMLAYRSWIARAGGVLMIVMGLWMLGVLRVDALQRERRVHISDKPIGYLGTVVVGIAFGAGWTPCLGPTLGAILILAANHFDFVGHDRHLYSRRKSRVNPRRLDVAMMGRQSADTSHANF